MWKRDASFPFDRIVYPGPAKEQTMLCKIIVTDIKKLRLDLNVAEEYYKQTPGDKKWTREISISY